MARTHDNAAPTTSATLAADLSTLIGQFKRRLREEASAGDFTVSQLSALGRLDRDGPMTVTELARAEGMRPQSMGANVAALEAAGMVGGAPDPADGRRTILYLTPACRELIRAGRAARRDWLSRTIQTRLSAAEQDQLAAAAHLLRRLLEP
ncbi:MAG: transcriptional regulator, MarR family [Tardiphaga sp.]|jgi:DNA-binding MarR family transcriptional regulator|nr:transcriptional regulator, MarR family [Tardiphaga sp.]